MEMRKLEFPAEGAGNGLWSVADLVEAAMRYKSKIDIGIGTTRINAKSFMGMTLLAKAPSAAATVIVEGPDEATAAAEFTALLQDKLRCTGTSA